MLVSVLDKSVTDAYFINLVMCECKVACSYLLQRKLSFNQTKHTYQWLVILDFLNIIRGNIKV